MSVNPFECALSIVVKSSFQKVLLIVVPHSIALVILLFVNPISAYLNAVFIVCILVSLIFYYQRYIARVHQRSVRKLSQDSARNWFISLSNNTKIQVFLLSSSFVSCYLIILNYRDINNKHYVVVFTPDSLSSGDFRRLVVRVNQT